MKWANLTPARKGKGEADTNSNLHFGVGWNEWKQSIVGPLLGHYNSFSVGASCFAAVGGIVIERDRPRISNIIFMQHVGDTSASPTGDYTTGDYFGIGWNGANLALSEYFDGSIDSVAVWDKTLSSAEVAAFYDTSDNSRYHLTTKEYDTDIGLYYFFFRWYDPTVGRFITRSPLPIFLENPYTYCWNNPVSYIDPIGTIEWSPYIIACEIVVCGMLWPGITVATGGNKVVFAIGAGICASCILADVETGKGLLGRWGIVKTVKDWNRKIDECYEHMDD